MLLWISIKLESNLIEITLRHGRSRVNLEHIFRTPFPKNNIFESFYFFVSFSAMDGNPGWTENKDSNFCFEISRRLLMF